MVDLDNILKKTITTDFDLSAICDALGLRCWIGSRDDLHAGMLEQYNYFIINIQSRLAGNGSHWTAMYKNTRDSTKTHIVYVDSYGAQAPKDVVDACRRLRYNLYYSNGIYQSFQSQNCGFFAVLFLLKMSQGMPFQKFRKIFSDDEPKNDAIVKRIITTELIRRRKL